MPDGLDALDRALRRAVSERAVTMQRDAQHEADGRIAEARHEADELVERARSEGAALADALIARKRAVVRRETGAIMLNAQRAVLEELDARVRAAVLDLRAAPDYPQLLEGLTGRARAQLGEEAVVTKDPHDLGGVIAEVGGRRLDYTLPALAARALDGFGDTIESLLR